GDEGEDLLVPKPTGCLAMDFERRRFEDQDMAAVFQGGYVGIERLPVVADQGHVTARRKLCRNVTSLENRRGGVPAQNLGRFALTESLQESNAATIGVETVHVVEDQWLMPVLVGFEIDAQRCGQAANPADASVQGLADAAAFANAGRAEEQQQMQVAGSEGA